MVRESGLRRLAVVLSVIGGLIGFSWRSAHPSEAQQWRWNYEYFRSEVSRHPDLKLLQGSNGWFYLAEDRHTPIGQWEVCCGQYMEQSMVETFPPGADVAPNWWEYWTVPIPAISGIALPWLILYVTLWVYRGFRPTA
jgi:hypothetical protein